MAENKNRQIAENVLAAVGGAGNIENLVHCITRLRFTLKDKSIPNLEEIKKIPGVLGAQNVGGTTQVIIGQNVNKVYDEVCTLAGISTKAGIDENLDAPKEKLTLKSAGNAILDFLSGSFSPFIPVMCAAGMFKTLMVVLGPDLLNLIGTDNNFYLLMSFMYDAAFYFMPVYLGYTSARKVNIPPVLGAFLGCLLVVPGLVALAGTEGATFDFLGIPIRLNTYGQSVVPVLLSVWIYSYIYKFFKKIIPVALSTVFVPFLSLLIMAPIMLCGLAPLGSYIGDGMSAALIWLSGHGGFIAVALIAGLWEFLVMTGMHSVILITGITMILTGGYEDCIMVGGGMATMACFGMALGAFLRVRNKEYKAECFGFFVSGIVGGITEPALYGIGMQHTRTFLCLFAGGLLGGLYAGLTHVACYMLGSTNILGVLGYIPGGTANMINGCIASLISIVATTAFTYLFGFTKQELNETSANVNASANKISALQS